MRIPLFLAIAIVLTVFAILAANATSMLFWGTDWTEWISGAFLSLLVHFAIGGLGLGWDGYLGRRDRAPVAPGPAP